MNAFGRLYILIASFLVLPGCGYHFQKTSNPFEALGIKKIYVEQFRNTTFRPGIEHYFTAAMVRELEKSKAFTLVDSAAKADAILTGEVTNADSTPSSSSTKTVRGAGQEVAAQYNAAVTCSVVLTQVNGRAIYSHSEGQSKQYPGTSSTNSEGATAALLNESEQRLAYQGLATLMMSNTYQNMVDFF